MNIASKAAGISVNQRYVLWITVGLMFFLQAAASQAAAFLYAVDEIDNSIRMLETATGVEITTKMLAVSGVTGNNRFDSVLGAAINPLTGNMYAVIDLKDRNTKVVMRKFVTINPRSGVATDIAVTDPAIDVDIPTSGLAFDSAGTLYAVSADSDLYTVELGTGVFTFVLALGNGLDGETIALNPDDGKLYHASGMGTNSADKVFESIDLNTLTVSNIPLSGNTAIGLQTLSLVYDATQGLFLGFRNDGAQGAGEYFSVTPGGVETFISAMATSEKSLVFFDPDSVYPPVAGFGKKDSHVYALDRDGPYLSQLDANTGEEIDLIGITLAAPDPDTGTKTLQGTSGLAMNPLNGELFATVVVPTQRSNHRLVRLDPRTGVATLIGLTGQIISGLTFGADGTLYAVSADDNAPFPSWLYSLRLTDAFAGVLFNFGTATTPADGEIIAFNSKDGLLYHASGGVAPLVETIDLTTGTFDRATVGLSGGLLFSASALVYDPLRDLFMGANADGGIFSMTPGGFVSNIQPARPIPLKGFGVITPPAKGDLGGDRKSDILWRNSATGQNWAYQMNGALIDSSLGVNTVPTDWQIVGNGDYNGDSHADILWRNSVTGQNWMYLMSGATIDSSVGVNTVPTVWKIAGNGDYNGDGKADILWRNSSTGQNWMYLMDGATIASSVGVNTVPTAWDIAGSGDYNGDGNSDILWRNSVTGQNWMYLMSGATIDNSVGVNTVPAVWKIAGNGDYNGDGNADILWRNSVTGQNWMYMMTGSTIDSSVGVNTLADPDIWKVAGDGDYNGDGKADILWRNQSTGENWMYLMSGATISSSIGVNTVSDPLWEIIKVD